MIKRNSSGFTFVELMVVMAIISIYFGLSSINLIKIQRSSSIEAAKNLLVADLRQQQIRAMSGDTGTGTSSQDYGIHFSSNSYILFEGSDYVEEKPSNFTINLDPSLSFSSIDFPSSTVIFKKGSGEVADFVSGSAVSILDSTNTDSRVISINYLGVTDNN